ncbi:MAG TPA: ADP-ribosylglycohydrolase family protein [Methanotrichaceae archaeon]|nr:ADP-ribosylglycohydrolase family protein [Methanotrichaceae archaeon]HQF16825.1 ADP-ribosylglycohydrolase family protein [Methanotrichaceae archaeon]HQI90151.1 ADP-ribosylglycohydrolase family protein [Methanotrichaceae archaeon]HQJ29127.1 ADP-ribosylglycohydrolase family protein [Methanotrichaceae archaeon]
MDLLDRFRGCLLGLAAGDALGMPVEGLSRREIKSVVGRVQDMMPAPVGHFHAGLRAGQYTDDTLQTLILAEGMIEAGGFSAARFCDGLRAWGEAWKLDTSCSRGAGLATRSAVEAMMAGRDWQETGVVLPTCGAAMRVAPVGLVYHRDLSLVASYAKLQAAPTHCSAAAAAGAVAVAVGVSLSLLSLNRIRVLEMAAEQAGKVWPPMREHLQRVPDLLDMDEELAFSITGTSPEAKDTVAAAFYCHLAHEPEEALIAGASAGGDTDSIASIAGALAGAACGSGWIPNRWLEVLEGRQRLERTAGGLADLSAMIPD